CFFFQAEDGIRAPLVTGVQTCALPISRDVVGIVAGLIGAAVVAVWFFAYDIARGRPFHTPGLLGAFVFYGVDTPVGVEPAVGPKIGRASCRGGARLPAVAVALVPDSVL